MGLCGCNLKEDLDCLKTSNDLTSNTHSRSGDRLKICRIVSTEGHEFEIPFCSKAT